MQYAYEDRIAELRAKVDRTTSRQLLDQEQFDQKLEQVMRRQNQLESRSNALGSLPDVGITGSIGKAPRTAPATDFGSSGIPKPSPISDTVIFVAPPDREARLKSRTPPVIAAAPTQLAKNQGLDTVITRLQRSLDQVETRQVAMLGLVEESFESRARRMRGVLSDLGLDSGQMEAAAPRGGIGGPFVAVKPSANANSFERQLYRIHVSRAQVERLNRTLALVPYRKPVVGAVEFSSRLRRPQRPVPRSPGDAHRSRLSRLTGDPVRATAVGKVVSAGWSGGYGRMVEIDHGNGLSTRYGHMSGIW